MVDIGAVVYFLRLFERGMQKRHLGLEETDRELKKPGE